MDPVQSRAGSSYVIKKYKQTKCNTCSLIIRTLTVHQTETMWVCSLGFQKWWLMCLWVTDYSCLYKCRADMLLLQLKCCKLPPDISLTHPWCYTSSLCAATCCLLPFAACVVPALLNYTARSDWLRRSVGRSAPISVGHGEIFLSTFCGSRSGRSLRVVAKGADEQWAAETMRPLILGEWKHRQLFCFQWNVTFVL